MSFIVCSKVHVPTTGMKCVLGLFVALAAGCSDDRGVPDAGGAAATAGGGQDSEGKAKLPEVEKLPEPAPGGNDKSGKASKGPAEGAGPSECDKIDLVFVIDDSRSMLLDHLALIAEFPNFIKVLNAYRNRDGDPLDYRIAVTTSSVSYEITGGSEAGTKFEGEEGLFRRQDNAQTRDCWPEQRRWIERGDPNLTDRFSCVAQVGSNGLGHEMQMLALSLSLDARVKSGEHEGFLRDDALLATILLTDEDDCSSQDQTVADFNDCVDAKSFPDSLMKPKALLDKLDAIKGKSRERWALGVLSKYFCLPDIVNGGFVPPLEPKARLRELAQESGKNAVYVPVCGTDYADSLKKVLDKFTEACKEFPPPV